MSATMRTMRALLGMSMIASMAIPMCSEPEEKSIEPRSVPDLDRFFRVGNTRRDRIHRLHNRTSWQLSVCRRLIDTKTPAEIEEMIKSPESIG